MVGILCGAELSPKVTWGGKVYLFSVAVGNDYIINTENGMISRSEEDILLSREDKGTCNKI